MIKFIKSVLLLISIIFLSSCPFETNGVTFHSITIKFDVSESSELLGKKIYLIYDYRDENIYYYDEFVIQEQNEFTWEDYGPYVFDNGDVATYDIAIRVGEENKLNIEKETNLEVLFEVEGDDKKDLHKIVNQNIITDYGEIQATIDFYYSFGAWY